MYLRFIADGNLDGNSDINIQGENLERVNTFKYVGATLTEVVYRQGRSTIFRMPIYPMLNQCQ